MMWGGPQGTTEEPNSVTCSLEDVAKKPHLDTSTVTDSRKCELNESTCRESKGKNTDEHSAKGECRRLAAGLIHMVFNRQHSIFEVTKKSKNYLAVMGVPLKNGGHVLFPEEAVFLIEHCNACGTEDGRLLTLHDGYRILGECGISMHVYRAYTSLRQVGFVVLRPNRASVHSLLLTQKVPVPQQLSKCERYPEHLLDCFPSLEHRQLFMPHLHRNLLFVPIPDLRDFKINYRGFAKIRRPQRSFHKAMRPRYWPEFDEIRSAASTWQHFGRLKRELIESKRTAPPPHNFPKSEYEHKSDFEVFLPDHFRHSQPSKPVFWINCVDSRYGTMSCATINQLSGDIPLVISIFDCGHVRFVEVSGESIDLNQYLRGLVEKFKKL
ncbi:hypothetical protein RB195_000477 [Necator americanus]|uniref:tRNA-splicing endonuclease subunit Sen54 N-terminal domain-containing protein n=1 Tax=Necator americanus TaxID=51031 RepID=A0ABR1DBD4_NECAM